MSFANNIRFLRKQRNISQEELAEMVGYKSFTTIQKWETGDSEPNMGVLRQLADIFHLSISELVETDLENKSSERRHLPSNIIMPAAYAVPILGTICAGDGVYCEENFEGYFYVDRTIKADYCLKVRGNSMVDVGIYDGDFAFLRKDFDYEDGEIYAVCWGAEESASLKKLYKMDNKIMLQPCNAEYSPVLADIDDVCIVGECVGTYHSR
jgi:putative prophage lambdaCh01, repressor protein|nr:MAG TPA: Repressor protein CI [Caudoviricetes sp.]